MTRVFAPLLLLLACAHEPGRRPDPGTELSLGPTTEPLPGQGAQHHATVHCADIGSLVARQVGASVRFGAVGPKGTVLTHQSPPAPDRGWNHPEITPYGDGWLALSSTWGAPMAVLLDADGAPTGPATAIHDDYPWGLWADVAVGEDGRAMAFWTTKTTPYWRLFDPNHPEVGDPAQSWDLSMPHATVDPPEVVAVPGGYVRAWTVKNGFLWDVRLLWVDLDGEPLGEPIVVAAGEGRSRGARPQLSANERGEIGVAWRIWPDLGLPPEGAFFRLYQADGQPITEIIALEGERADRATIEPTPTGWLVAWEHGLPSAVWLQEVDAAGEPVTEPLVVAQAASASGRTDLTVLATEGGFSGLVSWEEVRATSGDTVLDSDVRLRAFRRE